MTEERCNDYCLWEMMGDGNQMTGNVYAIAYKDVVQSSIINFYGKVATYCEPEQLLVHG